MHRKEWGILALAQALVLGIYGITAAYGNPLTILLPIAFVIPAGALFWIWSADQKLHEADVAVCAFNYPGGSVRCGLPEWKHSRSRLFDHEFQPAPLRQER